MTVRPEGRPRRDWVGWLEQRVNLTEIFSFLSHFGMVYTPVDTRKPVREALAEVAAERVPSYARGPRVLGLLIAILFGLEAVTGLLLAYYYRPTPEAAYESTRTIVRDLPAGWFIHQIHHWGAWLLVAVIVLRLLRLFWDGLYRAPRELLWMAGVGMAWIVLQLDFTGRLLTWDARSYWATVRGMEVVFALPVAGPILAFLLGGRVMSEDVLIRFYVLHVMVLPLVYLMLIYLSFATLRRVGLAARPGSAGPVTTYRRHLYSLIILTVLLFGVLVSLATLLPFGFQAQADPYSTPTGVRPPWYMLAPYAALQGLPLPKWITGGAMLIVAFAVLLLPFWLPREERPGQARRIGGIALAALVLWVALSIAGMFLDRR